jgi:hypothetical protein
MGCQYGDTNAPSFAAGACTAAQAAGNSVGPNGDANDAYLQAGQENAYQVTVTNNNAFAVNVSEVVVGYYDASGNEISSANEPLGIIQLAAGATVQPVFGSSPWPGGTVSVKATGWQ